MKKILATSWHPGGINSIIPVIKKLKNNVKKYKVEIIGHEFSENQLQLNNIKYKTLKDYNILKISYKNIRRLINGIKPDIILLGQSKQDKNNPFVLEQILIIIAKEKDIPTISVSDFWSDRELFFKDLTSNSNEFVFLPTIITAIDKVHLNLMIKKGLPKEKIIITGNPHFENLSKIKKLEKEKTKKIKKQLKLKTEKIYYYACATWITEKNIFGYSDIENLEIIDNILYEISNKIKNKIIILIKLHPRTPKIEIEDINNFISNKQKSNCLIIINKINSQDLILSTEMTITTRSTSCIEALILNKKTISLQPNLIYENQLEFVTNKNIISLITKKSEIKKIMEKIFLNENQFNKIYFSKQKKFKLKPNATNNIIKIFDKF